MHVLSSRRLDDAISRWPPVETPESIRRGEAFYDIPVRRGDVFQPAGCHLLTHAPLVDGSGVLLLARQLSPPQSLSLGTFQWSVLRFALLSGSADAVFAFDVKVPNVDVGDQGPFSWIIANATGTRVAVYSHTSNQCCVVSVPESPQQPNAFLLARTLPLPPVTLVSVTWLSAGRVAVLTTDSIVLVYDVAAHGRRGSSEVCELLASVDVPEDCVGLMPIDADTAPRGESASTVAFFTLACDGTVALAVATPTAATAGSAFPQRAPLDANLLGHQRKPVPQTRGTDSPGSPRFQSVYTSVVPPGLAGTYLSGAIIQLSHFLVCCRLSVSGEVEVWGVDASTDSLIAGDAHAPSSFLLDKLALPGEPQMLLTLPSLGDSSGPTVTVLAVSPEDAVRIEFPWALQLTEKQADAIFAPPVFVPSTTQHVWVSPSEAPPHYLLGICVRGSTATAVTCDFVATESPPPTITDAAAAGSGWDMAQQWTAHTIDTAPSTASTRDIARYQAALSRLWDATSQPAAAAAGGGEEVVPSPKTMSPVTDMHGQLKQLAEAFRALALPLSVLSDTGVESDTRVFTFPVKPKIAVEEVLDRLDVAHQKLTRLLAFRDNVETVQENLGTLCPREVLAETEQTLERLKARNARLVDRIRATSARNEELATSLETVLESMQWRIVQDRTTFIESQVLPLVGQAHAEIPQYISDGIKPNINGFGDQVYRELLMKSRADNPQLRPAQAGRELIRLKVNHLMSEFAEALNQCTQLMETLQGATRR